MQNINLLYFLSPIIMIAFSVGLIAYWRIKKRFTVWTLLLALGAYAGAIALKVVIQYFTANPFYEAVGGNLVAMGLYVGLQTVIFEVGGAYLAAKIAFSHGKIRANDAESYGLGLAFWENGVLIGGSALLSCIVMYLTLAGGGLQGQQLFDTLSATQPDLFGSASVALSHVGLAVFERVSSLFVHFAWGLLCVFAVAFKKKRFLLLALPMGMVDFIVMYAGILGVLNFEILFFAVCLLCLLAALSFTKTERKNTTSVSLYTASEEGDRRLTYLVKTNFKRALSFGSIYLILGIAMSFLLGVALSGLESVSDDAPIFMSQMFPLMLPLCAVISSFGGLMVFVSDRTKGVYEYLIAYGVSVYEIFWSTLLVTLGLVTVVLGVSLTGNIAIMLLMGGSIQPALIEMLLIYTLPISYAAVAFMTVAGMMWSSITARRPGINSPIGICALLGIAPVLAVYFLSIIFTGSGNFLFLTGSTTAILVVLVVVMMIMANKKMNRERLLADA